MSSSITAHSGLFWDATTGSTVGSDLQTAILTTEAALAGIADAVAGATAAAVAATASSNAATAASTSALAGITDAAASAQSTLTASVTAATTTISTSVSTAVSTASTASSTATTAATSATASASTATTKATAAANSATAAATSASSITSSVTAAATSATTAAGSASTAATQATAASVSAAAAMNVWGFRNRLINGSMGVWQRGTSLSPGLANYTADQWLNGNDGTGGTLVVSKVAPLVLGSNGAAVRAAGLNTAMQYALSGTPTGGSFRQLLNRMEDPTTFAGKSVRVSFWAVSPGATASVNVVLAVAPGTGGSPAGASNNTVMTAGLTSAWQQFTGTVTLPAASTITPGTNGDGFLEVVLNIPVNTAVLIGLTGVQVELNTGAVTPFENRPNQVELALCQRVYQTGSVAANAYQAAGAFYSTTVSLPVTLRSPPSTGIGTPTLSNCTSPGIAAQGLSNVAVTVTTTALGTVSFSVPFTLSSEL